MNIGNTLIKATGLATSIFWLILLPEYPTVSIIISILLSLIPIFICCLLTIVFTVFPFFWFFEDTLGKKQVFKTYFPYYVILIFSICLFAINLFNYELFAIAFFASAFFTLLQTWVWYSKLNAHEKI